MKNLSGQAKIMRTIPKYIKILALILILISIPLGVLAQNPQGNFIPCGLYTAGKLDECNFGHLIILVQRVLGWLVTVSFTAAIITFIWAGFIFLTTGVIDKRTEAKKMLWKIVIGFAIILSAWLIVKTIVGVLLKPEIGGKFLQF